MINIEADCCKDCPAYWDFLDRLCLIEDEISEPAGRKDIEDPTIRPNWCPTRGIGQIEHCHQCPSFDISDCSIQTEINMYGDFEGQQQDCYAHVFTNGDYIPFWCPFNRAIHLKSS